MRFVSKIVLINRYFYPDLSATSQMASDMAFAMARRGYDIRVLTSRQRYECPQERLPVRECAHGVEIQRIWTTRFGRSGLVGRMLDYASFYLSAFLASLRLVEKGDVIVVKTDPPLISVVAWFVARLRGARIVNWLQDLFPEVALALGIRPGRFWTRALVRLRNRSLQAAETNVVLGERMQKRLVQNGVASGRIEVIPNWADGARIRPVSPGTNGLRRAWGLEGRFVVGYSGNLGRAHEFQTMLGAMDRLRDDSGTVFVFIGGGVGMRGLERAVTATGLQNCRFFPYQPVERLAESLSVPDVHWVSLRPQLEGLIVPSKIYGITAAARPAVFIGDPAGEVGRLISACGCGFSVPIGEVVGLANRLAQLKRDPELAVEMGCRGRACFERHYDLAHGADRWEAVLSRLGHS